MLLNIFPIGESQAAILSALFGGAGVKILEKLLTKHSDDFTEQEKIRAELRTELDSAKAEADTRKAEADEWRNKYWHQVQLCTELSSELEHLKADLQHVTPSLSGSL